ncbi:MAG: trypsin-like peptidase domain-containing protein [Gammaproteobacteria bacterium]
MLRVAGAVLLWLAFLPGASAAAPDWSTTLERIANSVVAIQIDQTRAFDTDWNTSSQATGFVVDAERGLVLTNRHVVTPGPVTAQATFLNREEVELRPVYRDPVHDFGFYQYDPKQLRFARPESIPLAPEAAKVGTEIRVVGNDAGEQLSILAGTLARLERAAPEYGKGKYNDFNTFYLQAASSTSGGSSGSPVVDIKGRAVALNAGGSGNAASSFYLPLERVVRALQRLQAGQPVPRGTLQVVFEYRPFDELGRLGLDRATESAVRAALPGRTGLLVVGEVQPGSPADGQLEVGDIVLKAEGRWLPDFQALGALLDDSVGRPVTFEVRRGNRTLQGKVEVGDLHAITPDRFLETGDAILHPLSYQMARHFNLPVRGVFVANPGYLLGSAGVPRGALLVSLDGKPLPTLDRLEELLQAIPEGGRAAVRFVTVDDPRAPQSRSITVDRRWFPARDCRRDDAVGRWNCRPLPAPLLPEPVKVATATLPPAPDARAAKLAPSLVVVNYTLPYSSSGVTERSFNGTGLLVDAARGLVVVDRNTVPVAIGDARLIFGGAVEVPAQVLYLHPLHNLAVLAFDPAAIGATPVRAASLVVDDLRPGERVWAVGLRSDGRIATQETRVASVEPVQLPPSRSLQFRESNQDLLRLVNGPADFDGVLVDARGRIRALWNSFAFENGREVVQQNLGVPLAGVVDLVARVQAALPAVPPPGGFTQIPAAPGVAPMRTLDVELSALTLSGARRYGVPDAWLARLAALGGDRRQVIAVSRITGGSDAARRLQAGDILLAIDGRPLTRFLDVEQASAAERVQVTVWRSGTELTVEVATTALDGREVDRVIHWAGATLHAPHRALAAQRGVEPTGVFVAYFLYGSPATRYGLWAGRRIVEVDGEPTPDLDAFLARVRGKRDRESVRLKTVTWNGSVEVITLKLDRHYWPAYELRRGPSGWIRAALD